MTEPLHRFKVFETADPDDAVDRLARLFGNQKTSINGADSTQGCTSLSVARIASSFLCRLTSSHELLFDREEPKELIGLTFVVSGHMGVALAREPTSHSSDPLGYVLAQDEPFRAILRNYDGLSFGVPRATLHASLQALTGMAPAVPVRFRTSIDADGGGRILQHTLDMIARQLADPASSLGRPALAARLEEFVVHALLHGQPHNYSDDIAGDHRTATPKQVRRAEAFIHAHASETIRLAQIADAAGCSVRALQLAFKTFRGTTPMALLRDTRLTNAHADLSRSDPCSVTVTEIATKHGFYNLGRFAQDYRRSFGQSPSETLRLTLRPRPMTSDRLDVLGPSSANSLPRDT
ncbi:AraC family transcriptional regulator [Bradyrhizobium sp. ORS 86]|uniref:helix-turn-helix transcriptional regulator n=1 Tax=Bradyrhizobium sp. ORS 86 TaxID=1685970 RepID=UPI00388D3806